LIKKLSAFLFLIEMHGNSVQSFLAKLPLRVIYAYKLRQNYAPFYLQKHPTKPSF
jgi:hypothetical protein